jgi:prepilin-type processing-associated H-X9-DG protein
VIKTPIKAYMCPADPATSSPVVMIDWMNNTSTHHDSARFNKPLTAHHAPTSYSTKLGQSLPVAFTSYRGCWGQNWFLGSQWTNPAVGGPFKGDGNNQYDGCNCGDGLHFAQNHDKNLNVGRYVKLTDVSDGTSTTFFAGESRVADNVQVMWAHTDDAGASAVFDPICIDNTTGKECGIVSTPAYRFSSYHPGGIPFVFADGSVRTVSRNISQATWRGMASYNGGEVLGSDAP